MPRFRSGKDRIDGALLDVDLGHEMVRPIVDALLARAVPLVLATDCDAGAIPPAYARLPRRETPANGQDLTRALARVLAAQPAAGD